MSDKPISFFWKNKVNDEVDFIVYTENLKVVKKLKIKPSASYFRHGKLFAYHYVCKPDSDKLNILFEALKLTEKDERKQKRRRRTKAEMEAAKAARED